MKKVLSVSTGACIGGIPVKQEDSKSVGDKGT